MFGWFFKKRGIEQVKTETKKGFESVKKDIIALTGWIKHLDSEKNLQKKDIQNIKEEISSIKNEIDDIKNLISVMTTISPQQLNKRREQLSKKQTAVYAVQTGVQTGVQTPNFSQFSVTERAIISILLNTDLKLSYEDLAAMLGKEKSTIRGQINAIKQKSEGLIEEIIEKNGKKRIYIPEKIKEKMLKKTKVRVKKKKKEESK